MSVLGWALPALPLSAGGLLLVAGRRADRAAPIAGLAVSAATLLLAAGAAVARPVVRFPLLAGLPSGMAVDGLSAVMVVMVAAVTLAVLVYAAGELSAREARARFFGLMLIFAGAMLVTVTATDLALLLMAWELMGAMSYALIGFWWRDPGRVRSAGVAFVTTRAGDMGLYLAAGCALAGTGTLSLGGQAGAADPWRDLIAAGVVAAALGKSAQLPFSFWLSRAMAGPSPVSALLHSATMVAAGAYLLLRVQPLLAATGWAATLVAWTGAVTALALGAVALAQRDLKQLLAASTCAQIGFMVLAAGVGSVAGGTAQLVAHAAAKSLLFLGAGAWLVALGTKDLGGLHGAARRYPLVGVAFGAGALTLAGLPPLSLWVTKDTVLSAAAGRSAGLYAVGLAAGVLSAAYAGRVLIAVWRPADAGTRDDTEQTGTRHIGLPQRLPLPVLAAAAAALGAVGLPAIAAGWERLLGAAGEPRAEPVELAVSGALAALTLTAVGVLARRPRPIAAAWTRPFAGWLLLERAADTLVTRPVLGLANVLARFDDRVVDGGVRAVAAAGNLAATLAGRRVEMRADRLVDAVGRAARWLGDLARRPQTGQVHTYYAQAAVLFAALVLLVVLGG
ncbi:MAG TPA: proton-conducting transporter membrane subunit [Streptosporangiaceae bacterium]|nr:proton-conducting transporter membrane subunit [Streptosporangiaceae bacterium]